MIVVVGMVQSTKSGMQVWRKAQNHVKFLFAAKTSASTDERDAHTLPALPSFAQLAKGVDESGQISHWQEMVDPASGDIYFYNSDTCETQWEPPQIVAAVHIDESDSDLPPAPQMM